MDTFPSDHAAGVGAPAAAVGSAGLDDAENSVSVLNSSSIGNSPEAAAINAHAPRRGKRRAALAARRILVVANRAHLRCSGRSRPTSHRIPIPYGIVYSVYLCRVLFRFLPS